MPKNPFQATDIILRNGGVIETEGGTTIVEVDANGTPSIKANIEDALADGFMFIGDSNGVTSEVQMTGDVVINNMGFTSVGGLTSNSFAYPKMVIEQHYVSTADLTDGGGTTGTYDLPTTISAGSVFQAALVTSITGFAGDTTATIQVGDGTDVDRYNTGTPDVFASALEGVACGQPSGTAWHNQDETVTVTITSATDIGLVIADGNGFLQLTLVWLDPQGVIV